MNTRFVESRFVRHDHVLDEAAAQVLMNAQERADAVRSAVQVVES